MVDWNPGRGSEQLGRRPALVLQNDTGNQNPRYPNTVVLAMSTQGKPIPFHIQIVPNAQNGLREVTYVKCEQVLTIAKARLQGSARRRALSMHPQYPGRPGSGWRR